MRLKEERKDDGKKAKGEAEILGHDSAAAGRSRLGKLKVTDYEAVRKYRLYHLKRNINLTLLLQSFQKFPWQKG
jgi:hypothetical protein